MESRDRNVIMITADSLRADHCGFLNRGLRTTPTLDQMTNDGVVFANAISPGPRTPAAMPEIFTGEHLPVIRTEDWDWKTRTKRIASHLSKQRTIAQRFKELGYTTAAFTANPWTTGTTNFDSGFDHFHEVYNDRTRAFVERFSGTTFRPIIWISQWLYKDRWFSQWSTFYDDVRSLVETLDPPYFLWIFLMDTHTPFVVPRQDRTENSTLGMYYAVLRSSSICGEQDGMSYFREELPGTVETRIKRAYRDAIRSVDRFVGTLREDLSDSDPVFVFHSDHGEAFNEHGTYGHQQKLYEENINVPLLITNCEKSTMVEDPVSLRALPNMLTSSVREGRLNPAEWTMDHTASRTEDSETIAIRGSRWKYIASGSSEELYDLSNDPMEQRNLVERKPARASELRIVLDEYEQELPVGSPVDRYAHDPDTEIRDRLESLGYLT